MQSENDDQPENKHPSEGGASADSNTSAGSIGQTKSDRPAESNSSVAVNALPDDNAPQHSDTNPKATTQPEVNSKPESIAISESAVQPGNITVSDENAPPSQPFHVRKKSREEVEVEAAEHQTSALTPGLKEHPVQTHIGKAGCAVPMHETPENIIDRWTHDSFDKPEAKTPMGSMTATHIAQDIDMYNCGLCGETNSPRREKCKKCQNRLGGVRWK
ncbi:hypothetical protein NX059_002172 [Plenodomus lindquistii]|nr:hypothetical protein NX059_002172 [Plenodomus lindquistii]